MPSDDLSLYTFRFLKSEKFLKNSDKFVLEELSVGGEIFPRQLQYNKLF